MKALRYNTKENQGFQNKPNLCEGIWVIAISPVSDALPGNQNGVGCPLTDQLKFWLAKI